MKGARSTARHRASTFSTTIPIYALPPSTGTTYYVDAVNGNDSNNGLAAGSGHAWATLQKAANTIAAGSTVLVYNGTYSNSGGDVMALSGKNGSASNWTVIRAAPGQSPVVQGGSAAYAAGFHTTSSSYVCIAGFTVNGFSQSLTQSGAFAAGGGGQYTNNGILFGQQLSGGYDSHHLQVLNCTVSNWPGGGIQFSFCDYCTVQGCMVFNNAYYAVYQNSGISLWELHNFDNAAGFHNVINGNILYGNQIFVGPSGTSATGVTDGEGLIIDDNQNTESDNVAYTSTTLISNNIAYGNGRCGLETDRSNNCTVIYNTSYLNDVTPTGNLGYPPSLEFSQYNAQNNTIFNNIFYATSGHGYIDNSGTTTGSTWGYNITYNGTGTAPGSNNITSNPNFASTTTFTLNAGSPAIGAAVLSYTVAKDIYGNPRPGANGTSIGAVEYL